jgi:hypothetical protein
MDKVEVTETLMFQKQLLTQNMDSKNVFRIKFQRDGFFYLDTDRQAKATKGCDEVIIALKKLYPVKKGDSATIWELANASGLSQEDAYRVLHLMREFGLSVSASLDAGPLSAASHVTPGPQVAKVQAFADLYELRLKEHVSHIEHTKRLNAGDYSGFGAATIYPTAGLGVGGGLSGLNAGKPESKIPAALGSLTAHCERCNRPNNHKILGEFKESEKLPEELDEFTVDHEWQIIRCAGCNETRFRHYQLNTEHYVLHNPPSYREEGSKEEIYPTPQKRKPKEFPNMPDVIRELYCQTTKALDEGMMHLCAGGLRAIVEAICSEQGITGGWAFDEKTLTKKVDDHGQPYKSKNLDGKIWGLAEKGLVTVADAATLHKFRYLGNEALHEALTPTANSLEHAMAVIEHFLERIYELPGKASNIKLAGNP